MWDLLLAIEAHIARCAYKDSYAAHELARTTSTRKTAENPFLPRARGGRQKSGLRERTPKVGHLQTWGLRGGGPRPPTFPASGDAIEGGNN